MVIGETDPVGGFCGVIEVVMMFRPRGLRGLLLQKLLETADGGYGASHQGQEVQPPAGKQQSTYGCLAE
jgi:hypothetical protein